jgi:hypothetical protein
MNKTCLLLLLAAGLQAAAETNSAPGARQWLALPKLELREANREEDSPGPARSRATSDKVTLPSPGAKAVKASAGVTNAAPGLLGAETSLRTADFDADLYRRLERSGYLTASEPKSANPFVRSMQAVFEPEVVHVGKTAVSFSVVTAIKRKNPFCLLNPIPIYISW